MRHAKKSKKLSKPTDQRIALLRSLAFSLIMNGKIKTSRTRAKAVRKIIEKIVALSKKGNISSLRQAIKILPHKKVVSEFFKTAPERYKNNTGGVCRIINIGTRRGDNADIVLLELVG